MKYEIIGIPLTNENVKKGYNQSLKNCRKFLEVRESILKKSIEVIEDIIRKNPGKYEYVLKYMDKNKSSIK